MFSYLSDLLESWRDRSNLTPDTSPERHIDAETAIGAGTSAVDEWPDSPELEDDEGDDEVTRRGPLGLSVDPVFAGLAHELRSHGHDVRFVSGWRSRGRTGLFVPRGIMFHHTASPRDSGGHPCLGVVTAGRSDLPGPLSNFLVGRGGTIYVVARGRCNHAGLGGPIKGIPLDSGNAYLYGTECENDGLGEPWPEHQRSAISTLFAVVLHRLGRHARMDIGHKEYAPGRKFDPAGIDMRANRGRVRRIMGTL